MSEKFSEKLFHITTRHMIRDVLRVYRYTYNTQYYADTTKIMIIISNNIFNSDTRVTTQRYVFTRFTHKASGTTEKKFIDNHFCLFQAFISNIFYLLSNKISNNPIWCWNWITDNHLYKNKEKRILRENVEYLQVYNMEWKWKNEFLCLLVVTQRYGIRDEVFCFFLFIFIFFWKHFMLMA